MLSEVDLQPKIGIMWTLLPMEPLGTYFSFLNIIYISNYESTMYIYKRLGKDRTKLPTVPLYTTIIFK